MNAFHDYLVESLEPLGHVRIRAMFGGHGVGIDGFSIGLVGDDTLYLKVDGQTKPIFEAEGLEPFTYDGKGKPIAMSYHRAPDAAMDDPDILREWAALALAAARRAKKPKK
ncbi:TfoX/Sxy family protein [Sandaracinobacteroides saxicola]|uniref:TfoX/Sxy family protein n=1 Tax=Sandaracinobacteroides saxicola TaxID=2759707 RepID=A0A7G5IJE4_9SPHN|nr:TfoX/Sxy family protein [Sandaracinobacteroides saxicola]QMW23486.1 TfoX/Sxy family protein [Sandaracinobacteroides saxicola]